MQTLYQAIPTYTAQNIGVGKRDRIRTGLRHTVMLAVCSTFIISAVTFFFASPIASAFGIEGLSASYCVEHIKWLSFPILLFAYTLQYIPAVGYRSLFICKPMAWVVVASINYIYYFNSRWEKSSAVGK